MNLLFRRTFSALPLKCGIGKRMSEINFVGRDLIQPDGLSANEIKSLLWTAMDIRYLKQQNKTKNFIVVKDARVTLLLEKPCLIMQSAFQNAAQLLHISPNLLINDQWDKCDKYIEEYGKMLSLYSDIIFCKNTDQCTLEKLSDGACVPVIGVESCYYCLIKVLSNLMSLQLKHNHLKGLNLAWVGANDSLLNTYLCVLPRLGININYFCVTNEGEPTVPTLLDIGLKLSQQNKSEIHAGCSVKEVTHRADVIATSPHCLEELTINMKHIKEAAVKWSLLDYIPRQKEVDKDVYQHSNSLVCESLKNMKWIYSAIIIRFIKHYEHTIEQPPFDGTEVNVNKKECK